MRRSSRSVDLRTDVPAREDRPTRDRRPKWHDRCWAMRSRASRSVTGSCGPSPGCGRCWACSSAGRPVGVPRPPAHRPSPRLPWKRMRASSSRLAAQLAGATRPARAAASISRQARWSNSTQVSSVYVATPVGCEASMTHAMLSTGGMRPGRPVCSGTAGAVDAQGIGDVTVSGAVADPTPGQRASVACGAGRRAARAALCRARWVRRSRSPTRSCSSARVGPTPPSRPSTSSTSPAPACWWAPGHDPPRINPQSADHAREHDPAESLQLRRRRVRARARTAWRRGRCRLDRARRNRSTSRSTSCPRLHDVGGSRASCPRQGDGPTRPFRRRRSREEK